MIAALLTEYRKLTTTRLWWGLLVVMGGYMLLLGAAMAFAMVSDPGGMTGMGAPGREAPPLDDATIALTIYTLAASLGYVFPVVVGAMSVTSEYRHMTVTPTYLAEPRRGRVLGAKLVASVPVGLLFGLVGTGATVIAGAVTLAMTGHGTLLADAEIQRSIGLSVLVLAVWTVVGVGFGTVITNQVVAIVVLLAFTQFVEPVLRLALGAFELTKGVARWLPGAAGESVTGGSFYSTAGLFEPLPVWLGLVVLLGYGLVLAAVGRFTTLSRDVT